MLTNLYNSGPEFFWLLGIMYGIEFLFIAYIVIRQKLGIEDKQKPPVENRRWRKELWG